MRPNGAFPKGALVAALTLLAGAARADGFQDSRLRRSTLLGIGWEAAVPVSALHDYVEDAGYRGLQVELRRGVARSLSVGLAASWSWLAQTFASKTFDYGDATVSGPVYDRVRFATLRATADWYLFTVGPVQPYLGAGAGGLSWETYRIVGGSVERRSDFAPTVDGQLGVLVTVSPGAALHVQARYQYSTARFYGVEDASWLGIQVGVAVY